MHSQRRHLTQHRLRRLALWTLAMLTWLAAILTETRVISTRRQRQRFDISLPWLTRFVGKLLIVRAAQLGRLRRRKRLLYWRHGRDMRRRHLIRSVLGGRLRRRLKHRDAAVWVANLIAVLRDLDAYAAPLARRLRRGLSRLWRVVAPIAAAAALLGPPAPPPAAANSS